MAQATATETNGRTEEQTQADLNEKTHLVITIPVGLKIELDKKAADERVSTSALVRRMVADEMEYDLPATERSRARKYASEEERQAAMKQRRDERNSLFKALLAKYNKGEIKLEGLDLPEPAGAAAE